MKKSYLAILIILSACTGAAAPIDANEKNNADRINNGKMGGTTHAAGSMPEEASAQISSSGITLAAA